MKEAIYIGPDLFRENSWLYYGMTGMFHEYGGPYFWFSPDGSSVDFLVVRRELYCQNTNQDLRSKSCRLTVAT